MECSQSQHSSFPCCFYSFFLPFSCAAAAVFVTVLHLKHLAFHCRVFPLIVFLVNTMIFYFFTMISLLSLCYKLDTCKLCSQNAAITVFDTGMIVTIFFDFFQCVLYFSVLGWGNSHKYALHR